MNDPLIEALLAEQCRRHAALMHDLLTVVRWAGLPDDALAGAAAPAGPTRPAAAVPAPARPPSADAAVRSSSADMQASSLFAAPPRQVLGPSSDAKPLAGAEPPTARPRTSGLSGRDAEPAAASADRSPGAKDERRRQRGLTPVSPSAAAVRRSPAGDAHSAAPPRPAPGAPAEPGGSAGYTKQARDGGAAPGLGRVRLRAVARDRPLRRASAPSSESRSPPAVPKPAHRVVSRPDIASRASAGGAPPAAAVPRSQAGSRFAAPAADESRHWGWSRPPWAVTAGPRSLPIQSAPMSAALPPVAAPSATAAGGWPMPDEGQGADPFPMSALEDAIADALERAALEAGIDLT